MSWASSQSHALSMSKWRLGARLACNVNILAWWVWDVCCWPVLSCCSTFCGSLDI